MGKGEIARYEQFLLCPQCFQKTLTADSKNQGLFEKGLRMLLINEVFHTQFGVLKVFKKKNFENNVDSGQLQFSPSSTVFSTYLKSNFASYFQWSYHTFELHPSEKTYIIFPHRIVATIDQD